MTVEKQKAVSEGGKKSEHIIFNRFNGPDLVSKSKGVSKLTK